MLVQSWYTPYLDGLQVSWTSNTSLTVSPGICTADAESSALFGAQLINVGVDPVLDCTKTGTNGLQGGALANNTKYNVYAIGDISLPDGGAVYAVADGATISLPTGYSLKRRIFTFRTDGSAHILAGYQTGYGVDRTWVYDAPISVLSAGTSATYVTVDLSLSMPEIGRDMMVLIKGSFTPNASGDIATLAQGDSTATAGQAVITGFEATKVEIQTVSLPASADMEIQYKVTASGSLTAYIAGYVDSL